ncbi:uncharacterized protein N7518_004658 [Penicillium psychrosexuale]|uniref:uncharacterized protein n=1 Tax=Penicillium psychrosexuale TaxID=1002107 RepID=UPI002544E8FE|nr:uncharacterized protein N7518_004658 [Penicillium psychrosexuale]KAJ5796118.1 hypothetical protein N7518_004658 [Penicillium psychrosexuale]
MDPTDPETADLVLQTAEQEVEEALRSLNGERLMMTFERPQKYPHNVRKWVSCGSALLVRKVILSPTRFGMAAHMFTAKGVPSAFSKTPWLMKACFLLVAAVLLCHWKLRVASSMMDCGGDLKKRRSNMEINSELIARTRLALDTFCQQMSVVRLQLADCATDKHVLSARRSIIGENVLMTAQRSLSSQEKMDDKDA